MAADHVHEFRYCPHCCTQLVARQEGGRPRPHCPACGYVQYLNPAPGAGVIIRRDERICLVRRKFAPKAGQWTLPTGFMEWNEDIRETAVREVLEETGLVVELEDLFAVETGLLPPSLPVVVVFYRAREIGGSLQAGDDAAEVGFYDLDRLPGPIAFAAHRRVLAALAENRTAGPLTPPSSDHR